MSALLLKLLPGIVSFLGKYLPFLGAYLKGRSDAAAKVKAEANEEFLKRIDIADRAESGELPDVATDPNNRNRLKG